MLKIVSKNVFELISEENYVTEKKLSFITHTIRIKLLYLHIRKRLFRGFNSSMQTVHRLIFEFMNMHNMLKRVLFFDKFYEPYKKHGDLEQVYIFGDKASRNVLFSSTSTKENLLLKGFRDPLYTVHKLTFLYRILCGRIAFFFSNYFFQHILSINILHTIKSQLLFTFFKTISFAFIRKEKNPQKYN